MQDVPVERARIQEIYTRIAPFYDQVTGEAQRPAKDRAWRALAPRPGETVADVGAGTGQGLIEVAKAGAIRVVAIDFSPGMLAVAHEVLANAGVHQWVLLILGDATALPLGDASVDCVYSSYVLNVLPTRQIPMLLDELWRVLRPKGRLALVNLTEGVGADAAVSAEWRERFGRDPEAMSATRPVEALRLVQAAGFKDAWREYVGGAWPSEVILTSKP